MSLFKFLKKPALFVVLVSMFLSLISPAWASDQPVTDDLKGHWAETQLRKWAEQDLLKGFNGNYYPDRPITRAEFITLINRAFKLSEPADINFSDLGASHWAYGQIAIAVKAGYVKGYSDNTIRLNQVLSREEAAVMVANLLELKPGDSNEPAKFNDSSSISSWSKDAVFALADKSILIGNSAGDFLPQGKLTRAEAVALLDRAIEYDKPKDVTYSTAGVYGPNTGTQTIKGNVVVSASGVTLQNVIIEGDLVLAEGIGEGDATFKKVTVKGTTTIRGGGPNSIHFEDSVLVRISIDKSTGTVRVVAAGNSSVQYVVVHSPVKLEESSVTNSGFANVEIAEGLPAGSQVELIGQYEDVSVKTSDIKVSISSGLVKQLTVGENAANTEINLTSSEASITELILNAVAKLLGQGTVDKATVNSGAAGSSFQVRPSTIDGASASTVATPSTGNTDGATVANTGGSPSGNSGGTSGGGNGGTTGGGNGGSTGGNNGGGNTGNNGNAPCAGTAEECRDANLVNITTSDYSLKQLDANSYTTGETGFNPEVFAYSLVTDRSMSEPATVTFSITKSTYSTVSYSVADTVYSGTISADNHSFSLKVNALQDMHMLIFVQSGDKIGHKVYTINIQYPRTIQEAFKFTSYTTKYWSNGELVTQKDYNLQAGTLNGEKLLSTDSVLLYEVNDPTPFLTCTLKNSCTIPQNKITKEPGVWRIEVYRDGILIASGAYHYNFSIAPLLTSDIGFEANPFTKQELIDLLVKKPYLTKPLQSGYSVYIDPAKLRQAVPDAKYFAVGTSEMSGTVTSLPPGLSYEELKVGIQPSESSGYRMTNAYPINFGSSKKQEIYDSYHYQSDYEADPKLVNDNFVYVVLYDQNLNLLGQFITVVHFDQDHLADGYTAVGNWVPEP